MEENTTIVEETLENIEESSADDLPHDDIPTSSEDSTESGEGFTVDSTEDNSGISESVEESAAVPEETDTAADSTELEEVTEDMSVEELVSGNDIPQSVFYLLNEETETQEEVRFLEKPIENYSVTEGLLLLIFILFFIGLCYKIIFD